MFGIIFDQHVARLLSDTVHIFLYLAKFDDSSDNAKANKHQSSDENDNKVVFLLFRFNGLELHSSLLAGSDTLMNTDRAVVSGRLLLIGDTGRILFGKSYAQIITIAAEVLVHVED